MTDPLVDHVLALGLAALFASAAWHKLSAGPRFAAQLEAYELLPSSLASSAARALAFGELALAVTLVLPPSRPAAAVAAAGLLALYGGAGLRMGGVRMRSAEFGNTGFELFAGPFTTARASVALGRFVQLAAQAEAGWLLHGPRNPQGIPASFIGPYLNGVLILVSSF